MLIPDDKDSKKSVEEGNALPPAYTPASSVSQDGPAPLPPPHASSSSSSAAPATPGPLPVRYLTISRPNTSIKGTYAINPSLPPPPGIDPPISSDGRKLNMRLESQHGSIDANVELVRGPDAKGPALLEAGSKNGSVQVAVLDKSLHRFRLLATSAHGTITLRLPSTFTGPVSTYLKHGRLVLSPAVQSRLTTFSEEGHEGRFFIGDYAQSGFEGDESWTGDAVRAEANNGSVKIEWNDEERRPGFFSRFFS